MPRVTPQKCRETGRKERLQPIQIARDERARLARPGPGGHGQVEIEAFGCVGLRALEIEQGEDGHNC